MSYYPDKNQIPTGFEEWSFTNMPEDGEIVEVLSYGKVETMRFDKPYMAFNPWLIKMKPDADADFDSLLDAAAYKALIND